MDKKIDIEAIKYVLEKIKKQNAPSMDIANIRCRYFGENGRRCAFGHLLRDDIKPGEGLQEGGSAASIIRLNENLIKPMFRGVGLVTATAIQCAHDSVAEDFFDYPEEFKEKTFFEHFKEELRRQLISKKVLSVGCADHLFK